MPLTKICIDLPDWMAGFTDWDLTYDSNEKKMGLALALAGNNLERGTGLPFGAAVFDSDSGRPVGVGVNLARRCNNSILHAETMAIMSAQARLAVCNLADAAGGRYELVASSEPCAMCLGAAWYAGLRRVVHGTLGDEIKPYGYGLGPGLAELRDYLDRAGFEIVSGIRAKEVLELFARINK